MMAWSGMTVQALSVQAQPTKPSTMPGTMKGPEAEGRVVTVKGEQITLDNGAQLTVPKNHAAPRICAETGRTQGGEEDAA